MSRRAATRPRSRPAPALRKPLGGFEDFARLETAGADVLAGRGALDDDPDLLQVRVEAALGSDHRVGAGMPERRALSAGVTDLCHAGKSSSRGARGPADLHRPSATARA